MDLQETEIPNPVINDIVTSDRKAFEKWTTDASHQRRLDAPKEVLRYLLIPRRILELAEDPENVDIAVAEHLPSSLHAIVRERRDQPVSNPESFAAYAAEKRERELGRARQRGISGIRIQILHETDLAPIPPDVDSFHAASTYLIAKGVIDLNDFATNYIVLSNNRNPEILDVGGYTDREELQGKGVATSFYNRLNEAAKTLGFRFVLGVNRQKKAYDFFRKRGRSNLEEIKPEFRTKFHENPNDGDITVEFLYPEDREKYLIKSSNS